MDIIIFFDESFASLINSSNIKVPLRIQEAIQALGHKATEDTKIITARLELCKELSALVNGEDDDEGRLARLQSQGVLCVRIKIGNDWMFRVCRPLSRSIRNTSRVSRLLRLARVY